MSVKVFQTNANGKIEFTRAELEKLLNETYKEGHRDGENKANSSYWTWTAPYIGSDITNATPLMGTGTVTYRDTLSTPTSTSDGVTISCDNANVDAEEVAKLAGTPKITANVSVNGSKAQTYDLNSLAKEIDQILFGKPTVFACGTPEAPKNEYNANLAKELRNV